MVIVVIHAIIPIWELCKTHSICLSAIPDTVCILLSICIYIPKGEVAVKIGKMCRIYHKKGCTTGMLILGIFAAFFQTVVSESGKLFKQI